MDRLFAIPLRGLALAALLGGTAALAPADNAAPENETEEATETREERLDRTEDNLTEFGSNVESSLRGFFSGDDEEEEVAETVTDDASAEAVADDASAEAEEETRSDRARRGFRGFGRRVGNALTRDGGEEDDDESSESDTE